MSEYQTATPLDVAREEQRDWLGVVECREQYDGYFSQGWRTSLSDMAAYEALEATGLLHGVPHEIENFGDELWYVDTAQGSFYWALGSNGYNRTGVLAPDGFDEDVIAKWRDATLTEGQYGD